MANAFLEGNYRPVDVETTAFDLAVTGAIPDHLDGRYLRNGPNPIAEVDPETYHWFTGDGMVHGVRLRDGRAEWYRNRWVRSPANGGPQIRPGMNSSGANTNVIGHAGRTYALVEGGPTCYELDDELTTVGACDFDGTLPGGYTAHPKRDPVTGELHAVSYFFGWGNQVRYTVVDPLGRIRRQVDVTVGGSPMMHDFSLTENHVVFYDLPVTFDAKIATRPVPWPVRPLARLVMSALIGRVRIPDPVAVSMASRPTGKGGGRTTTTKYGSPPYRWRSSYPARIGVLPREGEDRDVRWFEIDPCFVFHPLNAYSDGDTIVLDVVRHPKVFDVNRHGPGEGPPTLDRWEVDLTAGKVRQYRTDDRAQEYPRVDERLVGRRHRYGYSTAFDRETGEGTLLRHDFAAGATAARSFGKGAEVSEFVFHPSAPDAAEDDGVLMGYVFDPSADRSDLMLLDAQTLDTVAAVHLPARVPNGFHGNWVPADS